MEGETEAFFGWPIWLIIRTHLLLFKKESYSISSLGQNFRHNCLKSQQIRKNQFQGPLGCQILSSSDITPLSMQKVPEKFLRWPSIRSQAPGPPVSPVTRIWENVGKTLGIGGTKGCPRHAISLCILPLFSLLEIQIRDRTSQEQEVQWEIWRNQLFVETLQGS